MRYTILVAIAILAGQLNAQESLKQTAYLKASNPHAGDHFGCGGVLDGHTGNSVAVSADGNTMAVGAPHADAVYVFSRNGAAWAQQAIVKASNAKSGAEFGHAVALSADGDTMAVSAYFESSGAKGVNGNQADDSIPQAGAATGRCCSKRLMCRVVPPPDPTRPPSSTPTE